MQNGNVYRQIYATMEMYIVKFHATMEIYIVKFHATMEGVMRIGGLCSFLEVAR